MKSPHFVRRLDWLWLLSSRILKTTTKTLAELIRVVMWDLKEFLTVGKRTMDIGNSRGVIVNHITPQQLSVPYQALALGYLTRSPRLRGGTFTLRVRASLRT